MKIGLFGGTFDPIHLGHLVLAERVRESLSLNKVVFIPSATPPHKKLQRVTPAALRLEMVKLAVRGNSDFEVSDIELNRPATSYTVETVREFRKKYPRKYVFFIVGQDSLYEIHGWYKVEELIKLCKIIFVNRPGYSILGKNAEDLQLCKNVFQAITRHCIEMPEVGISSTDIRGRVAKGLSIKYLVPEAVRRFINVKGLYQT